jgi:hypothetical protein
MCVPDHNFLLYLDVQGEKWDKHHSRKRRKEKEKGKRPY